MEQTGFLQSQSKVLRIRFFRCLQSHVICGSTLQFDVIVCSEFSEFDEDRASDYTYGLNMYQYDEASPVQEQGRALNTKLWTASLQHEFIRLNNGAVRIKLKAPTTEGKYSLHIKVVPVDASPSSECFCLPVRSDFFTVVAPANQYRGKSTALLSCYRDFGLPEVGLLSIKEDYGAALGSHVYDASVVLMRFLQLNYQHYADCGSILELGAGCGLVGIYLALTKQYQWLGIQNQAHITTPVDYNEDAAPSCLSGQSAPLELEEAPYGNSVVLSDKICQLSLLKYNAALNGFTDKRCRCLELDWESQQQLSMCRAGFGASGIDLIAAGDVFYDESVAVLFFKAIGELCRSTTESFQGEEIAEGGSMAPNSMPTRVLAAQKVRDNAGYIKAPNDDEASSTHQSSMASAPIDTTKEQAPLISCIKTTGVVSVASATATAYADRDEGPLCIDDDASSVQTRGGKTVGKRENEGTALTSKAPSLAQQLGLRVDVEALARAAGFSASMEHRQADVIIWMLHRGS